MEGRKEGRVVYTLYLFSFINLEYNIEKTIYIKFIIIFLRLFIYLIY